VINASIMAHLLLTLTVLGVHSSSSNASLKAFVLTDVHIDNTYRAGSDPATNCQSGSGNASFAGSYLCDTPIAMLDAALAAMREVEPAPDYVFWLGDQVPYLSDGRSMDEVYLGNANLTAKIMATFPQTRLIPLIGNHDTYPTDWQKAGDPEGSAARFLPLWQDHLTPVSRATFLKGGYYTELLQAAWLACDCDQ
jgi:sphingomyelin phosphodiesterase acid-like 3